MPELFKGVTALPGATQGIKFQKEKWMVGLDGEKYSVMEDLASHSQQLIELVDRDQTGYRRPEQTIKQ